MGGGPLVRARHLKKTLTAAGQIGPEALAHFQAALDREVLQAITDGVGVEWLPVLANVQLCDAAKALLGASEAHQFWRAVASGLAASPLLKTLVDGAVALFGLDPGSYARWLPRAWELVYRDAGRMTVRKLEEQRVCVRIDGLPYADHVAWRAALASGFSVLFDLAMARGEVEARYDPGTAAVEFILTWSAGR
jgi:hypothetical protein